MCDKPLCHIKWGQQRRRYRSKQLPLWEIIISAFTADKTGISTCESIGCSEAAGARSMAFQSLQRDISK
ncbi:unnamed protein product [Fusarium graminearum]|nr:unnamed protein product [Fusarium graminearum]CAG1997430.1 unnamed protein product [Fusarium graminearum]VTO92887.1 unnamed protein product [Fusarium graminearum]